MCVCVVCCVEVCVVWRCVLCGGVCCVEVCAVWCVQIDLHLFISFHYHTHIYIRTCFVRSVSFHFSLLNSHVSLLNAKLLSPAYVLSLLLQ